MSAAGSIAAPSPKLHALNRDFRWQDARSDGLRRLRADEVRQFNELGFFVHRGAFTPAEIAAVTAAIDPLEKATDDFVREQKGGRHRLTTDRRDHLHRPHRRQVAGADGLRRPPGDQGHLPRPDRRRRAALLGPVGLQEDRQVPQEFPWHQDNGYTFIEPQQYLTLWIPLVDVDEENGCPWIAPGMHKLRHAGALGDADRPQVPERRCRTPCPRPPGPATSSSSPRSRRTAPGPNLKAGHACARPTSCSMPRTAR